MPPFFSIAVTTYDRVDLLRQTLESILAQTFTDFEILVGNDNQNRQVRRDFPDLNDPRIRWMDHPKNLGYVGNVNCLLELAKGLFFTSLSDDDIYFPRYLETMHRAVTKYGSLNVAFCGFMQGEHLPLDIPPIEGSIYIYSGPDWLQGYLSKEFPAVGCYGVFEREFIRSLGGTQKLGSSAFPPYNDNLLAVQAGLGDKVAYCPDSLVFYRLHAGSLSYTTTIYDDFFSAQREFLALAEDVFRHPAHSNRRRMYRVLLLDWFIRDYFAVMRRGGTRSLSAIADYCFFILENLKATDNKMHILVSMKSNILRLYPRSLAFEKLISMLSRIGSNVRGIRSLVEQKVREIRHAFHVWRSWRRGRAAGLPGAEYFKFGRAIGWKLWFQNDRLGSHLLSSPVSSTRYFEFAFAQEVLPDHWQLALDVSSPFLFSLDVAGRRCEGSLHLMNPDAREIDVLRKVLRVQPPKVPVELFNLGVEALDKMHNTYDVVWSLSVVEHIESEQGDDRAAVKRMFAALRDGGRLVLTIPTDKSAWREYREGDPYGTQRQEIDSNGAVRYFFQRFYDARAIRERIIDTVGIEPVKMVWYGEKENGRFHDYIAKWRAVGREAVLDDPTEFVMHYQKYDSWESMPGSGVCGLVFIKPYKGLPMMIETTSSSCR